jgi:hypothetical protein
VTLPCGHTFSKRALEGVLTAGNKKCPVCRATISSDVEGLKVRRLAACLLVAAHVLLVAYARLRSV